jgi:hypothetical protein
LLIGQLPPLDVCEVTLCVDEVPDEVVAEEDEELVVEGVVVVVVADVESSDSVLSSDDEAEDVDDEELDLVAALAAVWVVAAWPSCQASTPPSDSIEATLRAAAARRARAARGLRRGRRPGARGGVTGAVGEAVCSSMRVNVRTGGERSSRAG